MPRFISWTDGRPKLSPYPYCLNHMLFYRRRDQNPTTVELISELRRDQAPLELINEWRRDQAPT